jgi:hypothetical protein
MSEHSVLLAVQRQVQGLVAEKAALQAQIDGLVAERDGLLEDLQNVRKNLASCRMTLDYWRKAYLGEVTP